MAAAVDQTVRPAPRPGQPGSRGGGAPSCGATAGRASSPCSRAARRVAAVAIVATGGVWHLPPAPQILVDATVGFTYPVIALVILLARGPGSRHADARVGAARRRARVRARRADGRRSRSSRHEPSDLVGIARPAAELALGLRVPAAADLGRAALPRRPAARSASGGSSPSPPVRGWSCSPSASGSTRRTSRARSPIAKPVTAEGVAQVLAVAAAVLLVPATIASVWSLVLRLRRSQGLRRRQVVVLLVAAGTLVATTLAQGLLPAPGRRDRPGRRRRAASRSPSAWPSPATGSTTSTRRSAAPW